MEDLKCLLLLTPSLVHLKLVSSRSKIDSIFDGSYWEQFIQNNLLLLNKFHFFFACNNNKLNDITTLDSVILPFQSPFWRNSKRWFVTCDYIPEESKIRLYTTTSIWKNIETRSPKLLISSINPKCRMILQSNEHMDQNSRKGTLTILRLPFNGISDIGAQYLADALRNHQSSPTVTDPYDDQANGLGDEGAKYFADALRTNKTLTTLDLSCNSIGDVGMKYLSDALKNNTSLMSLILARQYAGIGNTGIQCLSNVLRENKTLIMLDLSRNQIDDIAVQYLADALRNNQTLITLDLSANRIENNGLQYLANALMNNKVRSQ
ncbi:unnamed protein product [Adineta steineri]|uniref:Uncharacterized protein n=1 Tax=Adineta steineri TaxID=433720 RepID=A0A818Z894_9BILA|nr:unnamed protein product [Adineta steineri]